MRLTGPPRWWEIYANVVTLVSWMVEHDSYSKADLAYAVEKPWKYEPEAKQAGIDTGEEES